MPSKQVTDRQKSADAVVAALNTHGIAVAEALDAALSSHLGEGEAMPDVALLLSLVGRALDTQKLKMVRADDAHERELGDDEPARDARDSAVEALYSELVDLREVFIGLYGGTFTNSIFLGITPRDPVVLARFAQMIERNLEECELPAPRIRGALLDKAEEIGKIEGLRAILESHIQAVAREAREAQATQAAKNKAMDDYDQFFSGSATLASGLLRLAGKAELALQLRPARRRPGQTAADAGETLEPHQPPTGG